MPLVLAVHHSRGTWDIPLSVAEALVSQQPLTWDELGSFGDTVIVVDDTHSDPIQAIIDEPNTLAVLPANDIDERVRVLTVDGADPLRSPGDYPLTIESEVPVGAVITVTAVGDIMLGRRVGSRYEGNLDAVFEPFAERLGAADITIGNLESTLSRQGAPIQGGDSFAADPVALDA